MKRLSLGWQVTAALLLASASQHAASAQGLPPPGPILRIETGMHTSPIKRIGVDAACHLMVTGSEDKTARLWALPESGSGEPKLLRVLRVPIGPDNYGKIYAVALSPDGQFVAAGGLDVDYAQTHESGVYIFRAATGAITHRLGIPGGGVAHLTFSADGKYLAGTFASGTGLRVWETTHWTLIGGDEDYKGNASYGVAFGTGETLYTVAYDGFLRRYGQTLRLEAKSKTIGGERPFSLSVSPNGERIAVGFDDSMAIDVYDARTLERLFTADTVAGNRNNSLAATAWSADGTRLYAGGTYTSQGIHPVRIWDQEGHGKGRDVPVTQNTIVQILPCRGEMAVGSTDPAFGLISPDGEKRVWVGNARPDMRDKRAGNFAVSDDGSLVRFGLGVGNFNSVLFNLATGRLTDQPQPMGGLSVPETTSLRLSGWINNTAPKLADKPLVLGRFEMSRSVAIAPGGDRFVLGADFTVRAYDKDGKLLWVKPAPGVAWGVNVPRGGRYVVGAYGDGTIRWRRLSDGVEVLALFVNTRTREWVLWTPQGYYASSVGGDQNIGWHLNKGWEQAGEFVPAARLKKDLYRPDIVKRAFELADAAAAAREATTSESKLAELSSHTPPKFQIAGPGDKSHADKSPLPVKIEFATNGDPVTALDVKVNGKQVTPRAARDLPPPGQSNVRSLSIPLEKGENHVQITAHNAVGDSVQDLVVYLDHEGVLDKKGKLFIIAIGVDKYPKLGAENSLHFAAADARLMLDTLIKQAGPLHTEVKAKLLVTGGDTPPTKANIEDALLFFRDAGPQDTVVLFLAGHGVNEGADYLFMPEDAEDTPAGKNYRPSTVVKWHVLQDALQEAQGTRIMFVDTCHSRGAYNPRLIKDAADANIVVFSATDSATEAQERSELGHGVFTYALDEGLKGKADFMHRGDINVTALFEFVSDEVKRLTNDEQEPTFSASGVKNFVVAKP